MANSEVYEETGFHFLIYIFPEIRLYIIKLCLFVICFNPPNPQLTIHVPLYTFNQYLGVLINCRAHILAHIAKMSNFACVVAFICTFYQLNYELQLKLSTM